LLLHRLYSLQLTIHIPFSPLLISQFSPFVKLPAYRLDSLFRMLHFASIIGIRFAEPNPAPFNVDCHHTPIHELFQADPALYNSSIRLLKKHRIQYLSDCISSDHLAIMPFSDLIRHNSDFDPSRITPKWYHHIIKITAAAPKSLRLKSSYTIAQANLTLP